MESLGRFAVPRGAGFRVFLGRAGDSDRNHSQPRQRRVQVEPQRLYLLRARYEADERDYAEAEARRLNQAEMARLRRSAGN